MRKLNININKEATEFPHYWEMCVGSGHAVMGLREDWREQLKKAHDELGFKYIRFHGLFDDNMSVYATDMFTQKERFSFFNIDNVFDYLLEIGMKPFVELGFMPSAMASGDKTCFYYKGNITPPKDYDKWDELIKLFIEHLQERYGKEEVEKWFFEVWNEPNLEFFWSSTMEEYFKLYKHTADTIKSVNENLKVGGPATSINAWIPEIKEFCERTNTALDFVSTHHYPTDDPLWRDQEMTIEEFFTEHRDDFGKYKKGVLKEMTERANKEAGDLPLYYTEWNISAMVPDDNHDTSFSAAMVAKTIADNDGLVNGYSFWTFSDLFEEHGQYSKPFHGGFGLQTIHGVPKPVYRAFQMLNKLGNQRLQVTQEDESNVEVLATKDNKKYTILAFNHNVPGADIQDEEVKIVLKGLDNINKATIERIDKNHANPKEEWENMKSPEYINSEQIEKLMKASKIKVEELKVDNAKDRCEIIFKLPSHGVALITI